MYTHKLIYYLLFVGFISATSCSDFLNENNPDSLQTNTYFKTEKDVDLAVNGIYAQLRNTNYYSNMCRYTEIHSDNTTLSSGLKTATSGVYNEFDIYNLSKTNSVVQSAWDAMYLCINRSNYVLDNINTVSMNDDKKQKYIAQIKFLRALSYFHLVRLFGDVPLVIKDINSEEEAKSYKRMAKDSIYIQIVEDLKFVCESPLQNQCIDASSIGRVSKVAGMALLGKVYLTMYADLSDNKKSNLENAIYYLESAYNLKSFSKLSDINYADLFALSNETNPEIIFQIAYKGVTDLASNFAYLFQPEGKTGLTSLKVGSGYNLPESDLYTEYESVLDRRRTVSIGTVDGIRYCKKYVDLSNSEGLGGNNWIELRYADVILMLAEAYNELGGNEPKVKSYLDMVRTRANLKTYDESSITYHSKYPTFKEAILHERRVEFAFENQRWYDLLRFKKGQELIDYLNGKGYTFTNRDRLLPIPYREEKLDPVGMYQNEGY